MSDDQKNVAGRKRPGRAGKPGTRKDDSRNAVPPEARPDLLKRISLFTSLSNDELSEISGQMLVRRFRKNEVILREENTNEFMYIILEGEAKVGRFTEAGKEIIVSIHQSGDFFGELSLIDGKTVPATVTATRDSLTAIIAKSDFYALLFRHDKVLVNLLQVLAKRFRDVLHRIELMNFHNASQRIKMLFLMLAQNYGEKRDKGTVLKVRLIHQHIADMTGLTRETVTRIIDRWKKSGEIVIVENKFILLTDEFESIQF
jgi:CRP/FNR family transcriptional regulator